MSSLCAPISATWPLAKTMMTSQSWMVERRWAMAMEVRPSLAASRAACTTRSLCESNALVASSRSKIGGSRTSARQMATLCFWPPERRLPREPTCVCHPLWPSMKVKFAIFLHCSRWSGDTSSPSSSPYTTLSRMEALNRMGSCPTKPTCLRHHLMFRSLSGVRSCPTRTEPDAGS
mmetsp:Transcript_49149/g.117154  ORF Transcript_49149/g.117154 Transcript_49149/m.117154 type:complete len:176 (+) Transcript_49149:155-682(+)